MSETDVTPFLITTFLTFLLFLKVIFLGISPFPEIVSVPFLSVYTTFAFFPFDLAITVGDGLANAKTVTAIAVANKNFDIFLIAPTSLFVYSS